MQDPIDRLALLDKAKPRGIADDVWANSWLYQLISGMPTISTKPERCGCWIHVRSAGATSVWRCSECSSEITANFAVTNPADHDKFCYNCGVEMDEVRRV